MRFTTVVGARPQFIKAAVISRAVRERKKQGVDPPVAETIIHTGQHFDANMSDVFFDEMDIPRPDHHLDLGGGTHGQMTGRMIERIEEILLEDRPDWVLVYGDTNSTLAGALAAVKLHIPVAHVEAGLRSFNRRMPEEINRVLTDHAASLLFAPTDVAVRNLNNEGIDEALIRRVGDVMFDAMLFYRRIAPQRSTVVADLGLEPRKYALATVHRAENTDDPERLAGIVQGLGEIGDSLKVVLPLHPRTHKMLTRHNLMDEAQRRLTLVDPVGYLDMVMLEGSAAMIATDSGGVQKEAYFNRVPCLTLRDETEWVETVEVGANQVVGTDPRKIVEAADKALQTTIPEGDLYGDGRAGAAIVERLLKV